jgi:hypothetical protein
MAKQIVAIIALIVLALLSGVPQFIGIVLMVLWPIAAFAGAVIIGCSALSLSIWLIGLGVRSLQWDNAPTAEIVSERTFARDVPVPVVDEMAWPRAVASFLLLANAKQDFSVRSLVPAYLSRDDYDRVMAILRQAGWIVTNRAGSQWAPGWYLRRCLAELSSLPYPIWRAPTVYFRGNVGRTVRTGHAVRTVRTVVVSPGEIVYREA